MHTNTGMHTHLSKCRPCIQIQNPALAVSHHSTDISPERSSAAEIKCRVTDKHFLWWLTSFCPTLGFLFQQAEPLTDVAGSGTHSSRQRF